MGLIRTKRDSRNCSRYAYLRPYWPRESYDAAQQRRQLGVLFTFIESLLPVPRIGESAALTFELISLRHLPPNQERCCRRDRKLPLPTRDINTRDMNRVMMPLMTPFFPSSAVNPASKAIMSPCEAPSLPKPDMDQLGFFLNDVEGFCGLCRIAGQRQRMRDARDREDGFYEARPFSRGSWHRLDQAIWAV